MLAFTSQTARAIAQRQARIGRPPAKRQILQMQAALLASALSDKTNPADRAKCAQAWERLEERLRILKGKPLPGQLRPDVPDKHRLTKRKAPIVHALPELAPDDSRTLTEKTPASNLFSTGTVPAVPTGGPPTIDGGAISGSHPSIPPQ